MIDNFRREYDELAEKVQLEVKDFSMKIDHTIDEVGEFEKIRKISHNFQVKEFSYKIDSKLDEIQSSVEKDLSEFREKVNRVESRFVHQSIKVYQSKSIDRPFEILLTCRSKSVKRRHWTDVGDIRLSY